MKDFFLDVWQDLREKRLWPLAVALALGLAAVPALLLKGEPEQRGPSGGALAGREEQLPAVTVDSTGIAGSSKLDSFRSKDPFRSRADAPEVATALAGGAVLGATEGTGAPEGSGGLGVSTGGPVGDPGEASGSGGGSGGGLPSGGGSSSPSVAQSKAGSGSGGGSQAPTRERPDTRYYSFAADLSFGLLPDAERDYEGLEAVAPLVGRGGEVVVVYLGQTPEGESVFLVNQSFEVTKGERNCRSDCAFVHLRPESGRNEVVLTGDDKAKYRLRLRSVRRVLDEREASSESSSKDSVRRAKAAEVRSRPARAHRRTSFDFRLPLIAGQRR